MLQIHFSLEIPTTLQSMPTPVSKAYNELFHYTTSAGLAGIISSDCLWATHAAFLNDAEEMTHFFDVRLHDIVLAEARAYAKELAQDPQIEQDMNAEGGIEKLAQDQAAQLVSWLRSTTLSVNEPHIFSLSAVPNNRIRHSGLLSQWRGYGNDGGYAIVFDTKKLEHLLDLEAHSHHYQHVQWGDVYYYGIDPAAQPSSGDVAESEEVLRAGIAKLIRSNTVEEPGEFYQAISSLSCLYKHWGFQEEREVRVVVIPVIENVARLAATDGEARPRKTIKTFQRGGLSVPYLELFARQQTDKIKSRLPIKRVIVGPHRDRVLRKRAVEHLLVSNGYDGVLVVCSGIPYIGR